MIDPILPNRGKLKRQMKWVGESSSTREFCTMFIQFTAYYYEVIFSKFSEQSRKALAVEPDFEVLRISKQAEDILTENLRLIRYQLRFRPTKK